MIKTRNKITAAASNLTIGIIVIIVCQSSPVSKGEALESFEEIGMGGLS